MCAKRRGGAGELPGDPCSPEQLRAGAAVDAAQRMIFLMCKQGEVKCVENLKSDVSCKMVTINEGTRSTSRCTGIETQKMLTKGAQSTDERSPQHEGR